MGSDTEYFEQLGSGFGGCNDCTRGKRTQDSARYHPSSTTAGVIGCGLAENLFEREVVRFHHGDVCGVSGGNPPLERDIHEFVPIEGGSEMPQVIRELLGDGWRNEPPYFDEQDVAQICEEARHAQEKAQRIADVQERLKDLLQTQTVPLMDLAAYEASRGTTPTKVNEALHDQFSDELLNEAHDIECSKRPAYTRGSCDVHANFRRIAEMTGLSVGQVLSVYYLKHVLAIVSALCDPTIPQAEAIKGRLADAINYEKLAFSYLKNNG